MDKGLPKKYLETTDLGDVDKEYEYRFKERIKNMIDDSKKINEISCSVCGSKDIKYEEVEGRGLPPKGWVRKQGDRRLICLYV